MEKKLKILMILHMPWTRDLGAPRFSVEIAEEFEKRGHRVDKFDLHDAFPHKNRFISLFQQGLFPYRAIQFVRRHGNCYDVIQAEQGNLPVNKRILGYKGVLIVRSSGLAHFYAAYLKENALRQHAEKRRTGSYIGNFLRAASAWMSGGLGAVERSFNYADAIVLSNEDERKYVDETLGYGAKSAVLYNGQSEERFAQFDACYVDPISRLQSQQIVFVGYWSHRKGAYDIPKIVRHVRQQLPHTRFLFLGVGMDAQTLYTHFDKTDHDNITVVPQYTSSELPALLSEATAGILPSYIEGAPIGVLEQLAAGVPCVTYDVPGPREALRQVSVSLMTPPGNISAAGNILISILTLSSKDYVCLSEKSKEVAGRFRWTDAADVLLKLYNELC